MALDLRLNESEQMIKNAALDFLKRDTPKEVVQVLQETDTGCTEELWKKVVDMGWLGIIIPEEYGGMGSTLTSAGVLFIGEKFSALGDVLAAVFYDIHGDGFGLDAEVLDHGGGDVLHQPTLLLDGSARDGFNGYKWHGRSPCSVRQGEFSIARLRSQMPVWAGAAGGGSSAGRPAR